MSYDIELRDRVTGDVIQLPVSHLMTGGTFAAEYNEATGEFSPAAITDAWLNITYNYAHYYYEATEGDPRFAHNEVSCVYADGTNGPIETQYGIRGIYGKSGAESIPMLKDMIRRIEAKYKQNGEWITTVRYETVYEDAAGNRLSTGKAVAAILHGQTDTLTSRTVSCSVNEGPDTDYWKETAGNAIRPLWQLIAMAELRPDGVWGGD